MIARRWLVAGMCALAARATAQPSTTPPPDENAPAEKADQPTVKGEPEPGSGVFEPGFGKGFVLAKTSLGDLSLSAYTLFRYLDQHGNDSYVDHLGVDEPVNRRRDLTLHRMLVYLNGWIYDRKFRYNTTFWTILSTQQVNIIGALTYQFHPAFQLSVGVNGLPGTRSLQNVFTYFLGTDRVMADEYFKPGFTSGVWASGNVLPGLNYTAMVGNGLSQVGIKASQLTRTFATSASVWWMPTTDEFGARGGFGDWEEHRCLATRFGVSFTHSRENRQDQIATQSPDNTSIKLSDGLNAFQTGALALGVTLENADYWMLASDAGFKYRGFHLQGEYYFRWINHLDADGALPLSTIFDNGFYVQASYYAIPRKLMVFGMTSIIFGQFNDPWEAGGGANFYPFDTRDIRLNLFVTHVHESPVSSLFGYYVAGETGQIVSVAFDMLL